MSTLPTSAEMSWLFSSPGSVLATQIWRSFEGYSLTTENLEMSPPNSSSRFTAHGDMLPMQQRAAGCRSGPPACGPMVIGIEQAERAFEDRAEAVVGGQHVDRALLHQVLEPLGQRGLAAADGAEQVEDLLLLLEALRSVPEEADDALDGLLQAVEVLEGRIDLERPVHEDAAQPRILGRVRRTPARRSPSSCARPCWRTSTGRLGSLPGTPSAT